MLNGSEVKSLRQGHAVLQRAYADARDGELWLVGLHIPPYEQASVANHDPDRDRSCCCTGARSTAYGAGRREGPDARPDAALLQGRPRQGRAGARARQGRPRQAPRHRRARVEAPHRARAEGPAALKDRRRGDGARRPASPSYSPSSSARSTPLGRLARLDGVANRRPSPRPGRATVLETSTSSGAGLAGHAGRPMCTAIPRELAAGALSHSPVWHAGADLEPELPATDVDRRAPRSGSRAPGRRSSRGSRRRRCPAHGRGSARAGGARLVMASSSSRQRRSPSSVARSVEPTMSVKSTVASTRSGSWASRTPVRNSSISPRSRRRRRPRGRGRRPAARRTARPGCARRGSAHSRRGRSVVQAVHDQGRHADRRQRRRGRRCRRPSHERDRRAAGSPTLQAEPVAASRSSSGSSRRGSARRAPAFAPAFGEARKAPSNSSRVSPQGQSSVDDLFDLGAAEQGAGCAQGRSRRTALTSAPPSDTPTSAARSEPGRVHHGPDVVHPLLERRRRWTRPTAPCRACRTGSAARTTPSCSQKRAVAGVLPEHAEMGERTRDPDDVGGPSPSTWYAISTPPLEAYLTSGARSRERPPQEEPPDRRAVAELLVRPAHRRVALVVRRPQLLVAVYLRPADLRGFSARAIPRPRQARLTAVRSWWARVGAALGEENFA